MIIIRRFQQRMDGGLHNPRPGLLRRGWDHPHRVPRALDWRSQVLLSRRNGYGVLRLTVYHLVSGFSTLKILTLLFWIFRLYYDWIMYLLYCYVLIILLKKYSPPLARSLSPSLSPSLPPSLPLPASQSSLCSSFS